MLMQSIHCELWGALTHGSSGAVIQYSDERLGWQRPEDHACMMNHRNCPWPAGQKKRGTIMELRYIQGGFFTTFIFMLLPRSDETGARHYLTHYRFKVVENIRFPSG
jgi:hypothetical protein